MSVAGRFAGEFYRVQDACGDEPELLGNRISAVAARVLRASGAGVSVFHGDFRVPVGASDQFAAIAERLQFTTGEGPCLFAYANRRTVRSTAADLEARWPEHHAALLRLTPYRSVMAVPMIDQSSQIEPVSGCMDLFFDSDTALAAASTTAAELISGLAGSLLGVSASRDGGAWLAGPTTAPRQATLIALGMIATTLHIDTERALRIIRRYALGTASTVDDVADHLVARRLEVAELHG